MPTVSISNLYCSLEVLQSPSMLTVFLLKILKSDWHTVTMSARHCAACNCLRVMSLHRYVSQGILGLPSKPTKWRCRR